MEVYLDNSSTTKCRKRAADKMYSLLTEGYGNASSLHSKGIDAQREITAARQAVAESMGLDYSYSGTPGKNILFTSGGTESNNTAIFGAARAKARAGKTIITTKVEHPSVLEAMKCLEERGFTVKYLGVDKNGVISLDQLCDFLDDDTVLVSIMHINNETGAVMPVEKVRDILKLRNSNALFHVDATQSYLKMRFSPKALGIDLMTVSAHKIGGPKGVGALYISNNAKIKPYLFGGGQEGGMRSGTENVPGIAGFGAAVDEVYSDIANKLRSIRSVKEYLLANINRVPGVVINAQNSADSILSISVPGFQSEVMLHYLESKGIFVSQGSACSSRKSAKSHVLRAMNLPQKQIDSTLRISLGFENTTEDIDIFIDKLIECTKNIKSKI